MQKITGEGVVFIEIDGSSMEFNLKENEKIILSTGYLVSMDETCKIEVQTVKGVKNLFLGGEGIFNTVVTGPGKVITQTMPLSKLANSITPFLPIPTGSETNVSNAANTASSVINIFGKK